MHARVMLMLFNVLLAVFINAIIQGTCCVNTSKQTHSVGSGNGAHNGIIPFLLSLKLEQRKSRKSNRIENGERELSYLLFFGDLDSLFVLKTSFGFFPDADKERHQILNISVWKESSLQHIYNR